MDMIVEYIEDKGWRIRCEFCKASTHFHIDFNDAKEEWIKKQQGYESGLGNSVTMHNKYASYNKHVFEWSATWNSFPTLVTYMLKTIKESINDTSWHLKDWVSNEKGYSPILVCPFCGKKIYSDQICTEPNIEYITEVPEYCPSCNDHMANIYNSK